MSTVRQYELVYITPPETTEEALAELHQQIVGIVEKFGATISNTENWGRRKLAYEINRHREGVYVLEVINGPAAMTAELAYVAATGPGWSCGAVAQVVTCTHPGPLAPGASLDIRLIARVTTFALRIVNTVTVTAAGDINAINDSSAAILPPPSPAPTMSPAGIAAALLTLAAIAYIALWRKKLATDERR